MTATSNCPSCGGINDILMTTCSWCKKSLFHNQNEIETISDQEIVMNASEFVGLAGSRYFPEKPGSDPENPTHWEKAEIVGIAEKYLMLLKIRGINNAILADTYKELKVKFDKNKKRLSNSTLKTIGVSILGVSIILFVIFMALRETNDKQNEIDRLTDIESQIETAIKENKYDNALIMAEKLDWTWQLNYSESKDFADQYRNKKRNYKATIEKLKKESRKNK